MVHWSSNFSGHKNYCAIYLKPHIFYFMLIFNSNVPQTLTVTSNFWVKRDTSVFPRSAAEIRTPRGGRRSLEKQSWSLKEKLFSRRRGKGTEEGAARTGRQWEREMGGRTVRVERLRGSHKWQEKGRWTGWRQTVQDLVDCAQSQDFSLCTLTNHGSVKSQKPWSDLLLETVLVWGERGTGTKVKTPHRRPVNTEQR